MKVNKTQIISDTHSCQCAQSEHQRQEKGKSERNQIVNHLEECNGMPG